MLSTGASALPYWMPPQEPHSGSLSVPPTRLGERRAALIRMVWIVCANSLSPLSVGEQRRLAEAPSLQSLGRTQDCKGQERTGKWGAETQCVHLGFLICEARNLQSALLETGALC